MNTPRLGASLLNVFMAGILGDFDMDSFENATDPALLLALFIVFLIVVSVVMLNALIALLGESFAKMQEKAVAENMMQRALLTLEVYQILPDFVRRKIDDECR